jgi:sec-independent protein translocase protein TatA
MIGGIGPMEIAIVLVLALLVLGPKRLPSAGRSLGQGLREFKDGVTGRERSADPAALEPASHERSA